MNKATFNPGTPGRAYVPAVPAIEEVPPSVTVELTFEAAVWLYAFAGCHNGDSKSNPLTGLYGELGDALAHDSLTAEQWLAIAAARDRQQRAASRRPDGKFIMDVNNHR